MTALKHFLVGVLVIVTMPVWLPLVSIALAVCVSFELIQTLGANTLKAILALRQSA